MKKIPISRLACEEVEDTAIQRLRCQATVRTRDNIIFGRAELIQDRSNEDPEGALLGR